jgi:hypothetical protein
LVTSTGGFSEFKGIQISTAGLTGFATPEQPEVPPVAPPDHPPDITEEVTTPPVVPEPSSMLLLGSGVLGLAGILRRKLM